MRDINILSEDYVEVQRTILEAENFLKCIISRDLKKMEDATDDLSDKADFLNAKHSDVVDSVNNYDYNGLFSRLTKMVDSGPIPLKKVVVISKVTDPDAENPESACFSKDGCEMPVKSFEIEPNGAGKEVIFKKFSDMLNKAHSTKKDLSDSIEREDADKMRTALKDLLTIKSLGTIL